MQYRFAMRWTHKSFALLGLILVSGSALAIPPENLRETYQPIIDRNPFGLKPPPPPATNNPAQNVPPKAKTDIFLTGITSIGYPKLPKQAFFEVREQGKKDPEHYALQEGVEKDGIKVLSIDEVGRKVRIWMDRSETVLSFETHGKAPPAAPVQPVPGAPGQPGGQPGVVQPGVVPVPGANPRQPNNAAVAQPFPSPPSVVQPNPGGTPPPISGSGLRTIPSRRVRSDLSQNFGAGPAGGQPGLQQQPQVVDPAEEYLRTHLNRAAREQQTGIPMPPLPMPE